MPSGVARQAGELIELKRGLQGKALGTRLHLDRGRADAARLAHPTSVAIELIGCPLRRWRKVELVVGVARRATDKGLEAGALPKLRSAHGRSGRRQAHTADLARYEVAEHEAARAWSGDVH